MNEEDPGPELPLRMITEWVYCPRLFYLMQVEGQMVANDHVWRGRQRHEKTDKPGATRSRRKSPVPEEPTAEADVPERPESWQAVRAVALSSARLGITAKLDGVLLRDGVAIPTELKSGRAPGEEHRTDTPGVWDGDAVQVALQGILLEENGHAVPRGEVYYAASRKLVEVPLDAGLRERALQAVAGARQVQAALLRPAPLVDSPKCRGCSLVEVCLPDESNLLRQGLPSDEDLEDSAGPARPLHRRLVASRIEGRSIVVSTPGATVRKEPDGLVIVPPPSAGAAPSPPVRVAYDAIEDLAIMGAVHATTPAILACLERGIPVSFHAGTGRLLGVVTAGFGNNVQLRIAQHQVAGDAPRALALAREMVRGKLRNQRTLLRRNGEMSEEVRNEMDGLVRAADGAADLDTLMGIEGRFARLYFAAFGEILACRGGETFRMNGRSRRPPADPVNAMLSFGYSILARDCAQVLLRVGFDPMRGFLHAPGYGRPALALDLMEEFRALVVDSTVLRVVAEKRLAAEDFHREVAGVTLRPAARRAFLHALDQRREEEITHPLFGYRVSYRRALELQARLLGRCLEGEVDRYVALTTR